MTFNFEDRREPNFDFIRELCRASYQSAAYVDYRRGYLVAVLKNEELKFVYDSPDLVVEDTKMNPERYGVAAHMASPFSQLYVELADTIAGLPQNSETWRPLSPKSPLYLLAIEAE